MAVADLVRWTEKALEELFLKHLCFDISKDVATYSINRGVSNSTLQPINVGALRDSNLTYLGISRIGNGYC